MPDDHILVIAVDGLRASALGAYGNTSHPTPSLDRLACESFLLDACLADSAELKLIYRELWHSAHALRTAEHAAQRPGLPQQLAALGYATTLVSDEPEVITLGSDSQFDQCVEVAPAETDRAEDVPQTSLGRLFASACEAIEEAAGASKSSATRRPQFVWIHSRGMYGPWDAPLELQASLLDEDDPAPYDSVQPPDLVLDETHDPDTAFVCGCAYAAQAMVLDECVGGLLEAASQCFADGRWLLVLLGTRGYPLGEHRRVGGVDDRSFVEQLHVPWLLRMPDGSGSLARTAQLASHVDLLPTLLDWVAGASAQVGGESVDGLSVVPLMSDPCAAWRDALLAANASGGHAIRTLEWSLRSRSTEEQQLASSSAEHSHDAHANNECELYVRPDDRWENNDVANLCHDVVESLAGVVDRAAEQLQQGAPASTHWLPESLRTSID